MHDIYLQINRKFPDNLEFFQQYNVNNTVNLTLYYRVSS